MYDPLHMHILQPRKTAGHDKLRLVLAPVPLRLHVMPQIAPRLQIRHKVQIPPVLERKVHIDDKWMFQVCKQLPFMEDGLHRLLDDNLALVHLLHGVELVRALPLDFPDLSEAASADDEEEFEVGDVDV